MTKVVHCARPSGGRGSQHHGPVLDHRHFCHRHLPYQALLCFEHAYYVAVYLDAEPVYRLTDVRIAFPSNLFVKILVFWRYVGHIYI